MVRAAMAVACLVLPLRAVGDDKAPDTNVVFRNATIHDGTGKPPVKGDVHVKGDRIAAVGKVGKVEGATEIDATGPRRLPRLHRPAHALRLRASPARPAAPT